MRAGLSLLFLLTACQRMESSADVLPPSRPKPAPPVEAPKEEETPSTAAAEPPAPPPVPAPPPMSDAELLAVAMGLDPAAVAKSPAPMAPENLPLPAAPPAPAPSGWTPAQPIEGSWGVRLVSIVAEAQPPRAILGLPSGKEVVVEPGSFLPDDKIVVTAIGREALQLVRVVPVGDHVRIDSETLQPLYARPISANP